MAKAETNIVHDIMVALSPMGTRVFKNVRGGMYPIAAIKPLFAALAAGKFQEAVRLVRSIRPVQAGLQAAGSSDLIGAHPLVITQEMVGKTIAVFVAIEVKTEDGRASEEQKNFVEYVRKIGGFAGVARSAEDAVKIIHFSC